MLILLKFILESQIVFLASNSCLHRSYSLCKLKHMSQSLCLFLMRLHHIGAELNSFLAICHTIHVLAKIKVTQCPIGIEVGIMRVQLNGPCIAVNGLGILFILVGYIAFLFEFIGLNWHISCFYYSFVCVVYTSYKVLE